MLSIDSCVSIRSIPKSQTIRTVFDLAYFFKKPESECHIILFYCIILFSYLLLFIEMQNSSMFFCYPDKYFISCISELIDGISYSWFEIFLSWNVDFVDSLYFLLFKILLIWNGDCFDVFWFSGFILSYFESSICR